MASDRTRELARDVIDQVLMSYGAGFGTDKMLEIVAPKLDAFERETRLDEHQRGCELCNTSQICGRCVALGDARQTKISQQRLAELAAQPTPEVKK